MLEGGGEGRRGTKMQDIAGDFCEKKCICTMIFNRYAAQKWVEKVKEFIKGPTFTLH